LAAWTSDGVKLWTMFVEPPWSYDVVAREIQLEAMGSRSRFDARSGPRRTP